MTTQNIRYDSARPFVQVLYYDGKLQQMGEVVESVTVGGDVARAHRECTVKFTNTTKGLQRIFDVEVGKEVRIMIGKSELFRGVIFKVERDARGRDSLTAYDTSIYLAKNSVNVKFVDKTASQIIKELCARFGIPIGPVADTAHVIPRLIMRGKTLYDVFITALTMTQKVTGKRFMLANVKGKLLLNEVRPAKEWMRFEGGKNLIDASYTESIEDTRTQVEYTGGDENEPFKKTVKKNADKYGIMQHTEHNTDANQSALPALANALIAELSKPSTEVIIEVLGMPEIKSGKAVVAKDILTGVGGTYFVSADSHTFSSGRVHTMTLTLSKTLDLPALEYEPPNEDMGTDSGRTAEYDVPYTTGWVATAYDPMLGGINTSGDPRTTASSTRWSYNRTIAVDPKTIPHGSVVAIKVPSMPKYNGLYLAEDSGGAIKGKRVDILIQGKSATASFGRRDIEVAILERGKGAADARAKVKQWDAIKNRHNTKKEQNAANPAAKGKAAEVLKTAHSYKGKLRYVFGSKNLPNGTSDCSGFISYVFNMHGVKLPHGTSGQIKVGSSVSKADAKPGDLVFFQNTYRKGVSHVGVVTRKGHCISMHNSGCTEHTYTTGNWGNHYMSIRRVL